MTLFVKNKKKKPAKEVHLGKIAVGKIMAYNFNKRTPSQVTFTEKLTKKIVKFCRIFQRTEAMFNVQNNDNILLSRVL